MKEVARPRFKILPSISEPSPVGLINIDFEQISSDIDLAQMTADMNSETKKSILYMPEWPDLIEKSKVLFLPIPKE